MKALVDVMQSGNGVGGGVGVGGPGVGGGTGGTGKKMSSNIRDYGMPHI